MAEIDISFKIAAHNSGRDLCRLAHILPETWEEIGDTLQTTERLADRAFRAQQGEARFVVYFEAYTEWRNDACWNILAKSALLSERERLPTRTLVFVLTPDGYREQHGTFRLEVAGAATQQIWFHEICLWRERPQPWWEQALGLMALLPLCAHGRTEQDAVTYAAQRITAEVTDTSVRADLLATLAFFGKLAYPALAVVNLIGVENMRESKFAEELGAILRPEIRAEVQAEVQIETRRADILEAVTLRFGSEAAQEFSEALNKISDMDKLAELHRLAITSRRPTAFRRALESP